MLAGETGAPAEWGHGRAAPAVLSSKPSHLAAPPPHQLHSPSRASHAEPALTQSFPGFTKQEPQGKRLLEMVVPPALAPSLAADLVECKYWLEVRLPGICYTGASW